MSDKAARREITHVEMIHFEIGPLFETFLRQLNIADQFDLSCQIGNFMRYFLRFLSAYVVVAFTLHRTIAIRFPLWEGKIESKKIAWSVISALIATGLLINSWVPLIFGIVEHANNIQYCDIVKHQSEAYFSLTIVYIAVTMLIPILVIFACNSFTMVHLLKESDRRAAMSNAEITRTQSKVDIDCLLPKNNSKFSVITN